VGNGPFAKGGKEELEKTNSKKQLAIEINLRFQI
jgi:hypothetical protein